MSTATVFSDWDKREEFRQLTKGVGLLTSFLRDGRMDQSMQRGYLQFVIRAGKKDIIHGALSHLLLAPLAHSPDIPSPLATSLLPAPWAYHALGLKAEEKENFCCDPETYMLLPQDHRNLTEGLCDEPYIDGLHFPELNFTIVRNGEDPDTADALKTDITLERVEIYPLTPLFEHLDTNGSKWKVKNEYRPVIDPRFAVLYGLAKLVNQLDTTGSLE